MLPPRLEHHHRHGVGQVQAAVVRLHWQAQALTVGQGVEQVLRQATGFRAEQEGVAIGELHRVVAHAGAGAQREQALGRNARQRGVQVRVHLHARVLVVVQAGTLELPVVDVEAEGFDQVQSRAGVGA